jgi:hypothetical protein
VVLVTCGDAWKIRIRVGQANIDRRRLEIHSGVEVAKHNFYQRTRSRGKGFFHAKVRLQIPDLSFGRIKGLQGKRNAKAA